MLASSYKEALGNRRFLQLWCAQFISQTSQNVINFALAVLVNVQTGSTLAGGVIVILFSLPAILLGPLPGMLVDRVGRWWVLWVANLLRTLLALGAGLIFLLALGGGTNRRYHLGVVALIYAFSLLLSCTTRFFLPAEATAIPRLLGLSGLAHGLALFGVTFVAAQGVGLILLGPALHAAFGWPALFFFGVGCYAVTTLLTFLLPRRRLSSYQPWQSDDTEQAMTQMQEMFPGARSEGFWHSLKAGWWAIAQDAEVRTAVIRLSLAGVVLALVGEVAPNFVVHVLHRPPEAISLILAPAALALIVGAVVAPRLAARLGRLPTAGLGVNLVALALLLLALNRPLARMVAPPHGVILTLAVAEAALLGFAMNLISIPCQAVIQERVLPVLRGRVIAFQQTLLNLIAAPALIAVGLLADIAGISWALLLLAGGIAVAAHLQRRPARTPELVKVKP